MQDCGPVGQVAVIIPTFNEAENLEEIVGRVRAAVPAADILVADDNSPDGTGEIADKLAADDEPRARSAPASKAGTWCRLSSRVRLGAGPRLRRARGDGRRRLA